MVEIRVVLCLHIQRLQLLERFQRGLHQSLLFSSRTQMSGDGHDGLFDRM